MACAARGAKSAFADVDTAEHDETPIEAVITIKTRSYRATCGCGLRNGHYYGARFISGALGAISSGRALGTIGITL